MTFNLHASRSYDALIYLILGAFVGGVSAVAYGVRHVWRQRILRTKLSSSVGDLRKGPAEVQGTAAEFKPLASPLGDHACVYWRYTVEVYRRSYREGHWFTLEERRSAQPFYLEDATGRILVDPHGADLEIPMTLSCNTTGGVAPTLGCVRFMKSKGWLATGEPMRFTEWTIAPGSRLFVFGTVTPPRPKMARLYQLQDPLIRLEPILNHLFITHGTRRELILASASKAFFGIAGGIALLLAGIAMTVAMLG